jgi:ribonuclease D
MLNKLKAKLARNAAVDNAVKQLRSALDVVGYTTKVEAGILAEVLQDLNELLDANDSTAWQINFVAAELRDLIDDIKSNSDIYYYE